MKTLSIRIAASIVATTAALGAAVSPARAADDFPNRPIRFIVPFAPGGATDVAARLVANQLQQRLAQPVVVENKPGAATTIAGEAVARAAPDGYTLLFAAAPFALNTALGMKLPYDPLTDFEPVSLVASIPILFVVHPSTPYLTLQDVVKAARSNPQGMNYSTAGVGSMPHLLGEALAASNKLQMVHIGYKGAAPALQDAIAGNVPMLIDAYIPTGVQVKAGKLRAIAIASKKRSAVLPDTPTTVELGFPDLIGSGFYGVVAPAKTPKAIIDKLNSAIVSAVNDSDVRQKLIDQGYDVHASTPAEYAAYVRNEIERWTPIVKAAGIKP